MMPLWQREGKMAIILVCQVSKQYAVSPHENVIVFILFYFSWRMRLFLHQPLWSWQLCEWPTRDLFLCLSFGVHSGPHVQWQTNLRFRWYKITQLFLFAEIVSPV
jgi:hypothetical protein